MALGTINLNLRTSLYSEMGKGTGGSNYSLGQCKYGVNDIDISNYAAANPSMVKMSYWKNYDQDLDLTLHKHLIMILMHLLLLMGLIVVSG